MRRLTHFLAAVCAIILIGLVAIGANLYFGIDDAYAQWGTVDLVIAYLKDHDGEWPNDWEALRPYFDRHGGRVGGWSFDEFRNRVVIDFDVDADELRRQAVSSETPTFNVIRARWTIGIAMDDGPNAMLNGYFRRQAGIFDAPRPRGGWRSPDQKELANMWYRRGAQLHFDNEGNVVAAWSTLVEDFRITDNDLADLKGHKQLVHLNLVGSAVTDAGMASVRELVALERLELSDHITDDGIEALKGHPQLAAIDLFATEVTSIGLLALRELPNLQSIRLDKAKFGEDALQQLRERHPALRIEDVMNLSVP